MSSFSKESLVGKDPLEVVSEIHGFIDERALHGDGASSDDIREIKAALDAWTKDRFGFTPMGILKEGLC